MRVRAFLLWLCLVGCLALGNNNDAAAATTNFLSVFLDQIVAFIQQLWNWFFAVLPPAPSPPSSAPALVPELTTYCTCESCTDQEWNQLTEDKDDTTTTTSTTAATCGERIAFLQQQWQMTDQQACARIGAIENPKECGACDPDNCDGRIPPASSTRDSYCGCEFCKLDDWKTSMDNGGWSCEARITWLQLLSSTQQQPTLDIMDEISACRQVAMEYPDSVCAKECHPDTCPVLYCFPEEEHRVRYEHVWNGNYRVEVKQREEPCGPGYNQFTNDTVSITDNNNTLTLQFKYNQDTGNWQAAEVRVVQADGSLFDYGAFDFSVRTITIRNEVTGAITGDALPISLVLGLFTWDDTDDYSIHENYNHEVDIEISQWDDINNPDAQFLVQPPQSPHYHRFWTGGVDGNRDQSGHRWSFTWNPGVLSWETDAGGGGSGQTLLYSTEQAIGLGLLDHVQCLPANVEVRMNLWNLRGTNTPTGLTTDETVEVVIDDFVYTPSDQSFVNMQSVCSKDCQCEHGCDDANNVCAGP